MDFSKEQLTLLAVSIEYYATHFDRSKCQDSQKLVSDLAILYNKIALVQNYVLKGLNNDRN